MKTQTVFVCEHCNRQYRDKKEAEACEKSHIPQIEWVGLVMTMGQWNDKPTARIVTAVEPIEKLGVKWLKLTCIEFTSHGITTKEVEITEEAPTSAHRFESDVSLPMFQVAAAYVRALGKTVRIWQHDATAILLPPGSLGGRVTTTATNSREEFEEWYKANVPDTQDLKGGPWTRAYKGALWRVWAASRGIKIIN